MNFTHTWPERLITKDDDPEREEFADEHVDVDVHLLIVPGIGHLEVETTHLCDRVD